MGPATRTVLLLSGLVLICLGVSIKWGIFPVLVTSMVLDQIDLSPGTEVYDGWANQPPISVLMKFYLFNVTNPEEVLLGGKPIVQEVGPYTYKEVRWKEDILSIEEFTSYGSYVHYEFQPHLSCDGCNDEVRDITVINIVYAGIERTVKKMNIPDELLEQVLPFGEPCGNLLQCLNFATKGMWFGLNNDTDYSDQLFNRVSARELVLSGYTPGTVKFVVDIFGLIKDLIDSGLAPPEMIPEGFTMPSLPPQFQGDKFSFYLNATTDYAWYKINNGKFSPDHFNSFVEVNGKTKLPDTWYPDFGPSPSAHKSGDKGICKDIRGTDGSLFSPFREKGEGIWVFNYDLCRPVFMEYKDEVTVDGVKAFYFAVPNNTLDMNVPENTCYCPDAPTCAVPDYSSGPPGRWDMSNCTECITGTIDSSGCKGAAVLGSLAHYLDGDPSLYSPDNIVGIHPDPLKHSTYMYIEPITGVPMEAHKRIQASLFLQKSNKLEFLNNVKDVVFPLVWMDEGFDWETDVADDIKSKMKMSVVTSFILVDVFISILITVGSLMFIITVFISCRANTSPKDYQTQSSRSQLIVSQEKQS